MSFPVDIIRKDFPILATKVNGKPLIHPKNRYGL
jgi:selenocysteine lyase/cysteine desulfurase